MVIPCESADNIVEKPIKRCLPVLLSALLSLLLNIRLDYRPHIKRRDKSTLKENKNRAAKINSP